MFHANGNHKKAGVAILISDKIDFKIKNVTRMGPSRWWRSETGRLPSSPQIHQEYIYMWNNSYRTPTEHWQKTSDFPKGKKLRMYLGRAKEKRKTETKE